MQESKDIAYDAAYNSDSDEEATENDREIGVHAGDETDPDGWQQYRQWISKAPAPRGRRVGIDPSLYTWKGYRNWSEEVKRNWDPDAPEDGE